MKILMNFLDVLLVMLTLIVFQVLMSRIGFHAIMTLMSLPTHQCVIKVFPHNVVYLIPEQIKEFFYKMNRIPLTRSQILREIKTQVLKRKILESKYVIAMEALCTRSTSAHLRKIPNVLTTSLFETTNRLESKIL